MTKQNGKSFLVTVCADCGSAGSISELPDGKTFFHCYTCGGSKMTTVETIFLFTVKEFKNEKQ